jgi:hypothetical protein
MRLLGFYSYLLGIILVKTGFATANASFAKPAYACNLLAGVAFPKSNAAGTMY